MDKLNRKLAAQALAEYRDAAEKPAGIIVPKELRESLAKDPVFTCPASETSRPATEPKS
jgi:hypothetical protein